VRPLVRERRHTLSVSASEESVIVLPTRFRNGMNLRPVWENSANTGCRFGYPEYPDN